MAENKKYEKGTYGWCLEQAKKAGFDNIRDWQNWRREKINKRIKNGEFYQSWTKEKVCDTIRNFVKEKGRPPIKADLDSDHRYPTISIIDKFEGLNNLIIEAGFNVNRKNNLTNEELLGYLIQFFEENGRSPGQKDFDKNPKYPSYQQYVYRFGSWGKALKRVRMDITSMVRRGIIETDDQKARLAEILVLDHFPEKDKVIDLAGENCLSPYDGICPNGQKYDVKGGKLYRNCGWNFVLDNSEKDKIDWFYILAFNEYYSKILHVLRIPAWDLIEYLEEGRLWIGKDQLDKMRQYEITEKFIPIFENWLNDINQYNTKTYNAKCQYDIKLYDRYIMED